MCLPGEAMQKIWLSSIIELLPDAGKKVVELMIPTSKIPTDGAN
jgi:hypothetical protein